MKKITCMLILITLLTSCAIRKRCERKFPAVSSSVNTKINTITIIRDTTIYTEIPGDTVFQLMPLVDGEVSKLNTPLAKSTAWISAGKLNHRLEQKDTVVPSHIKGALKTTIEESNKEEVKTQFEYINSLTSWQWLQVYCGRVFIGVIIIIVGSLIGRFVLRN